LLNTLHKEKNAIRQASVSLKHLELFN